MDEAWKVTSQRNTVAEDPDTGGYANMVEIRFVTEHGDTGMLYVRPGQYDPDKVRAMIDSRVAAMNAVRGIGTGG